MQGNNSWKKMEMSILIKSRVNGNSFHCLRFHWQASTGMNKSAEKLRIYRLEINIDYWMWWWEVCVMMIAQLERMLLGQMIMTCLLFILNLWLDNITKLKEIQNKNTIGTSQLASMSSPRSVPSFRKSPWEQESQGTWKGSTCLHQWTSKRD